MKIQTFMEKAGKGACLALCYIQAALEKAEITPTMMFDILWEANGKGIIDANDDMFVKDAISLMKLANPNKKYSVVKQKISSLDELGVKTACVNFKHNGYNHWVLVEDGEIVFNSLDNSQCVKYGEPIDARIIKIEDK